MGYDYQVNKNKSPKERIALVITSSKYLKGRYDVLNSENIVIDFRFSKRSAITYAKRHNIPLVED